MSDAYTTTATPETTNAAPTAHPPVRENQRTVEAEVERGAIAGQQVMRSVGGGSPAAPPDRFAGALGQMQSASGQARMLRQLQRSYGNSYVGRVIQAKLTVNQPGDNYEQEADRMAAQVMTMAAPQGAPSIQREMDPKKEKEKIQMLPMAAPQSERSIQREMEPKKEKEKIQMLPLLQRAAEESQEAGANLESQLNSSKGGGSPLPDDVRSFMEPRFGADFSQVRAHTDSEAVQMNRDLNAQAFTHRQDVYFGAGKSPAKDALTAHELTHVVQQTGQIQPQPTQTLGSSIGLTPLSGETRYLIQRDPTTPAPAAGVTPPSPPVPAVTPNPSPALENKSPVDNQPVIEEAPPGEVVINLGGVKLFNALETTKTWEKKISTTLLKVPIPELGTLVSVNLKVGGGAIFNASFGPGRLNNVLIGLSRKQAVVGGLLGGLLGPEGFVLGGLGLLAFGSFRGVADLYIPASISVAFDVGLTMAAEADLLGIIPIASAETKLQAAAKAGVNISFKDHFGLYYQNRHLTFHSAPSSEATFELGFGLNAGIKASLLGFEWTKEWSLAKSKEITLWKLGAKLPFKYDNGLDVNKDSLLLDLSDLQLLEKAKELLTESVTKSDLKKQKNEESALPFDLNVEYPFSLYKTRHSLFAQEKSEEGILKILIASNPEELVPALRAAISDLLESRRDPDEEKDLLRILSQALEKAQNVPFEIKELEGKIINRERRDIQAERSALEQATKVRLAIIANELEGLKGFNIRSLDDFFKAPPQERYIPRDSQEEVGEFIRDNLYDDLHNWGSFQEQFVKNNKNRVIKTVQAIQINKNTPEWEQARINGLIEPDADINNYDPTNVKYSVDHITPVSGLWNEEGWNGDDSDRNRELKEKNNLALVTSKYNSSKGSGGIKYRRFVGSTFTSSIADGGIKGALKIKNEAFRDASGKPLFQEKYE